MVKQPEITQIISDLEKAFKNDVKMHQKRALQATPQSASISTAKMPPKTLQNRGPKASKVDQNWMHMY